LLGGAALLAVAAAVVFWGLLKSDLADAPGDLIFKEVGGTLRVSPAHPRETRFLAPAESGLRGGQRVLRYDFRPSTQPALPLRLLGGDWLVERGAFIQDTSRTALAVNQVAARALWGPEPVPPEGLQLAARVRLEPAVWSGGAEPRPVQAVLAERLPGAQALLGVELEPRVGLGILDERGELGLQVLLPLPPARRGLLRRGGAGMEGGDETFELPEIPASQEARELRLRVKDGRASLALDGQVVVEKLAGFPVGFRGLPAVLCQNARCTFGAVEVLTPAGAP